MEQGPLDELFEWRGAPEAKRSAPIHESVLELPEDGGFAFVSILWNSFGSPAMLHAAMREHLEAVFLGELSVEPHEDLPAYVPLKAAELWSTTQQDQMDDALRAFGLMEIPAEFPSQALAKVRGAASHRGLDSYDAPRSRWRVDALSTDAALQFEAHLRTMELSPFGHTPGELFAALNSAREKTGRQPLPPKVASFAVLEEELIPEQNDVLRWIPPIAFQALCDAVAVCVVKDLDKVTQWAPSEDGAAPVIRFRSGSGWAHVPLARDLLRWCVMPTAEGERVPPLTAWIQDRFR